MPFHRITHALDAVVTTLLAVVTSGAASALLTNAEADPWSQQAELKLLLLPLIGAAITAGALVMLNPTPQLETRRIVVGRAMFALLFGALGPSLIGAIHPGLAALSLRPVFAVALGSAVSFVVYICSKPFTTRAYERADAVSAAAVKALEEKANAVMVHTKTVTVEESTPVVPAVPRE